MKFQFKIQPFQTEAAESIVMGTIVETTLDALFFDSNTFCKHLTTLNKILIA